MPGPALILGEDERHERWRARQAVASDLARCRARRSSGLASPPLAASLMPDECGRRSNRAHVFGRTLTEKRRSDQRQESAQRGAGVDAETFRRIRSPTREAHCRPLDPRLASLRSRVVVIPENPKTGALTQRRLWVSPFAPSITMLKSLFCFPFVSFVSPNAFVSSQQRFLAPLSAWHLCPPASPESPHFIPCQKRRPRANSADRV